MKKNIILSLALVFVFSLNVAAFYDINNHINQEAINYLKNKNIVQGYIDGSYGPDLKINRAEFLKIVLESLNVELSYSPCFPDVQSGWYVPYVCKAKELGIINGYQDGYFRPFNDINLVESLKIILEAYKSKLNFDYEKWYEPYYYFMQENQLLDNVSSSRFDQISRGEMAQLIFNLDRFYNGLIDSYSENESNPDEQIVPESQSEAKTETNAEDSTETDTNTESNLAPEFDYDYLIYNTTNQAEGFGFIDNDEYFQEKDLPIVAVERENVKVLIPEGYETIGKAHVEDLLRCEQILGNFFGGRIDFPENKIVLKIYISKDGSNKGSAIGTKMMYKRSQSNIDLDLEAILTNNPDGFLYNSSTQYCSNTHELTHAFFGQAPIPSWANEGLAQFTQYHNQGDIFHKIDCREEGYYKYDEWYEYSDMSANNVLDYNTAMCYTKEIVDTYGWPDFYAMLDRLNKFQTGELPLSMNVDYHFMKDVLEYVYSYRIYEILEKYGISEEDYDY